MTGPAQLFLVAVYTDPHQKVDEVCRAVRIPLPTLLRKSCLAIPEDPNVGEKDSGQDVEAAEFERRHTGRMWTRGAYIRRWEEGTEHSVDLADLGLRKNPNEGRMLAVRTYFDVIEEETSPKGLDWARDVLCVLRREGLLIDEDPKKGDLPLEWFTRRKHFMPRNFVWMPKPAPTPPLLPPPLLLPLPLPPPPPVLPFELPITSGSRSMNTDPFMPNRSSRATRACFCPEGPAASTADRGAYLANPNSIHAVIPRIHPANIVYPGGLGFPPANPGIYTAGVNTRPAPQGHNGAYVMPPARIEPVPSVFSQGVQGIHPVNGSVWTAPGLPQQLGRINTRRFQR